MPKRKQPPADAPDAPDAPSGPNRHTRKKTALPLPEQELPPRRSQRSRTTVAATEAAPPIVAEQSTAPVSRTRRSKATATQQSEPVVEDAPAPTRTRATRSRAAKVDNEPSEGEDEATEQPPQSSTAKPKRETRKKKAAVPPSTRVTRSRSNSVVSVGLGELEDAPAAEQTQNNEHENAVDPAPAQPTTRKIATARGKRKAKDAVAQETEPAAETTTEAAVAEYSGPRSRTRSKVAHVKGKENDKPVTEAPKRATRSKKVTEPTEPAIDIPADQPRVKRQKVQASKAAQGSKQRRGRSTKTTRGESTEPEPSEPITTIPTAPTAPAIPIIPAPPLNTAVAAVPAAATGTTGATNHTLPGQQGFNEPSQQLFQEQGMFAEDDVIQVAVDAEPAVETEEEDMPVRPEVSEEIVSEDVETMTQELDTITQESIIGADQETSPSVEEVATYENMEVVAEEELGRAIQESDVIFEEPAAQEAEAAEVEEEEEVVITTEEPSSAVKQQAELSNVEEAVTADYEEEDTDVEEEDIATNAKGTNLTVEEASIATDQETTATAESVLTHTEQESEALIKDDIDVMDQEPENSFLESDSYPGSGLSGVFDEVSLHDAETSEQGVPDARVQEEEEPIVASGTLLNDIAEGEADASMRLAQASEQGVPDARVEEEDNLVVTAESELSDVEGEASMHFAQASEQEVPDARVVENSLVTTTEPDVSMPSAEIGGQEVPVARVYDFDLTLDESDYARLGARQQGVHIVHQEGDDELTLNDSEVEELNARLSIRLGYTVTARRCEQDMHNTHFVGGDFTGAQEEEESGQGVQFGQAVEEELVTSDRGVQMGRDDEGGVEDIEMMDVDSEFVVEEERGDTPEKGDAADGAWSSSANPSALAPLSQAAINAGHTAQDVASPEEAGSGADVIVPQTPTRPAWGQWGHLRHQPRLSSPLKSYCITAQYSPPTEDTPARGRRVSENGIISRSGDPSPLRSEELLGRDFNTPVGSPSQSSPRMRPTPGPRRRSRSRSVCGSSPLKNAVDFAALDAGDEAEGSSRPSSRMASPLARLASDYDPNQEISELREEEVLMTPNAEQSLGNILDGVVEEQLPDEGTAVGSDDSNDDVVARRPSQGFDGADGRPRRRSRLPVPKHAETTSSSPLSARSKRVSHTKNLSDRELSKVTARNTTRNGVYKNAKFERKVVRITRQRPPSPTRDTQTAAAEEARQLRQRVFEETGVALGPGDDSDYVPPQVSPSAKKVKWHERLEHELDDEEQAGFYTEKGILAPERVRRDSSTVHEITIQKILYDGERDILDEDFEEGF